MNTTNAQHLPPELIRLRIEALTKRERRIRTMPTTEPDEILSEEQTLADIRQEKIDLANQIKQRERQSQDEKQARSDASAIARDDALKEIERLRTSLLKRANSFESYVEDYQELVRLQHVACVNDRSLKQQSDDRAMVLDDMDAERSLDRPRVVLTNAFGNDLLGVPPFVQKRNDGYSIRDAIERNRIRLY